MRVIMFIFGGRKANLELALPYYARILADNPNVEVHLWDLARDPADSAYMRTITGIDRLTVRTEFYDGTGKAMHGQNRVWRHYCGREYRDALFCKGDDDDVFWQTDAFPAFMDAVDQNRDTALSARVVNNGACTFLEPELWQGFQSLRPVIPQDHHPDDETASLLGVHRSAEYADLCHRWFFANWQTAIKRKPELVEPKSWMSINAIGFDWNMCRRITSLIGTRSPRNIFDRTFGSRGRVGDEGAVNLLPMRIYTGLTVAHLNFGPQIRQIDGQTWNEYRKNYADIARQYLSTGAIGSASEAAEAVLVTP